MLTTFSADISEGTFEFIEAKMRRDAEWTAFGGDFEWLSRWFLENAPRYRGQFDKVWLWKDWPQRWGPDAGIDLVARTRRGELWAVQAKADHSDRAISKREIDSFLSESNRPEFAYRLLIATTDDIGANARRTIQAQEKPVGLVLRGHLVTEELEWPTTIGGSAEPLVKWTPKPHQRTAIEAVINGFREHEHDRGRLIMACGTGKTVTALWIAERLESSLTLVLVPSLSLVQQNLVEWGRHAAKDFDTLVVCSDESVATQNEDTTIQSKADLGVKPTTDPVEIRQFLGQRRKRPAVVFATYQSSDRIAAAQTSKTKPFDLVICDEAHRLAGHAESLFATVLDPTKIKARKRLFMTATPRYFKDHVKRRAAELEYELVSMDDEHVFGPEFHVLTFHEAITAEPPLLTDYQVVVIGVTDRDAKAWAERATLVRTASGLTTDARTLAAQIGLAKAMRKYDLRRLITFHSSVAKAARFVDATQPDSLPGVIPHLTPSARPAGTMWAKHISGHTPAGQRATLLNSLGHLPDGTRGIISNCACLGEGVDVPVLDGVAFIDPKRSMVDIIQAVGRVIRKAEGKQLGTIVIPVFLDETEDPDTALSQSAFEPVWQVLKALRAHDRRLADELDQLRLELGKRSKSRGRINLPDNIKLDVPRLLLHDFEQAFYVRTVEQTTYKPRLTIEQILVWTDTFKVATGQWPTSKSGRVTETEETWLGIDSALKEGSRGLVGGSSLARLLAMHRGKRNKAELPEITISQILQWIDAHHSVTGGWPTQKSGKIIGTDETWSAIQNALQQGLRGLNGNSSLAKLLAEHRGKRNIHDLPDLTVKQILEWADAHKVATGRLPTSYSGPVIGTDETWSGIDRALRHGYCGLSGNSSLANLLAQHRGKRNHKDLPRLTVQQILSWADAHKEATGEFPKHKSGAVPGTSDNWIGIDAALRKGFRGLVGNSSLAKLLAEYRGKRNPMDLPDLTIEQILVWVNAHKKETGGWPKMTSGQVTNTDETWLGIDTALRQGFRGLPGNSSLAKLLAEHYAKRNHMNLSDLTIEQILIWADAHKVVTGQLPNQKSGRITGTDESWLGVDHRLRRGGRSLRGNSSLAQLFAEQRGKRNVRDLADLTEEQILEWSDAHKLATGRFPTTSSGRITGTDETWLGADSALREGLRGLRGNSSLAQLLAKQRGKRNIHDLPDLTVKQILEWADAHKVATGRLPTSNSGRVNGTDETWSGIDRALRHGYCGLPGNSSLAKFLAEHRGKRNHKDLPDLTVKRILEWADKHKATTGKLPIKNSGRVIGTNETWLGIDHTLRRGGRRLPGNSSLAKLLAENRGKRNIDSWPKLTIQQILAWADEHKTATGALPSKNCGSVTGTDETWRRVDDALRRGNRGLPGGSSLAKLLRHHSAHNER